MAALVPMAEAMARLDQRQVQLLRLLEETSLLVAETRSLPPQTAPETRELLLEILNSLQPPPEQEIISLLSGPPRPPTSPPSSAS